MNTRIYTLPELGSLGFRKGSIHSVLPNIEALADLPDQELGSAFAKAVDELQQCFHAQENLMEELCYLGLKDHREQHARVLGVLHHAQYRVVCGDYRFARKVIGLLLAWLTVHTHKHDAQFAEFESTRLVHVPAALH